MAGEDVPHFVDVLLTDDGQFVPNLREMRPLPGESLPFGRELGFHRPLPYEGRLQGTRPFPHFMKG